MLPAVIVSVTFVLLRRYTMSSSVLMSLRFIPLCSTVATSFTLICSLPLRMRRSGNSGYVKRDAQSSFCAIMQMAYLLRELGSFRIRPILILQSFFSFSLFSSRHRPAWYIFPSSNFTTSFCLFLYKTWHMERTT